MLSQIWRFFLAILDWRTLWRSLRGRPEVDVVFITNLRDEAERRRFFGSRIPAAGHANGPRIHLGDVAGRVRGIFVTAEEMLTKEGRRLARQQFIAATQWAEQRGARVILLAASTKRLFGRDGRELKERFPHLLFTIGDNGTSHMLGRDVLRAFAGAGLSAGSSRIMVIGPYGILGEGVTRLLVRLGYDVIGYGANATALAGVAVMHGIPVATRIAEAGMVDAVVACTHSAAARLTARDVAELRRPGRRLLVVDVAEPANLDMETYAACSGLVVRQDAGNAYASRLHYVLGPLSWRKLILSRGVVFGCFAEALALFGGIHRRGREELAGRNWFVIDDDNMAQAAEALAAAGFDLPAPRCFGRPLTGFHLEPGRSEMVGTAGSPIEGSLQAREA